MRRYITLIVLGGVVGAGWLASPLFGREPDAPMAAGDAQTVTKQDVDLMAAEEVRVIAEKKAEKKAERKTQKDQPHVLPDCAAIEVGTDDMMGAVNELSATGRFENAFSDPIQWTRLVHAVEERLGCRLPADIQLLGPQAPSFDTR